MTQFTMLDVDGLATALERRGLGTLNRFESYPSTGPLTVERVGVEDGRAYVLHRQRWRSVSEPLLHTRLAFEILTDPLIPSPTAVEIIPQTETRGAALLCPIRGGVRFGSF